MEGPRTSNFSDSLKKKVRSDNDSEINIHEGVRGFHHLLQPLQIIKQEYIVKFYWKLNHSFLVLVGR